MISPITRFAMFRTGYALMLAVFVSSVSFSARAQGVGSSRGLSSGDGNHTIQGRVYFPAGQSNGKALKVILETNNSMGGSSTVTDLDGTFRFNNLRPGTYAVVIDGGKEYEAAREPVNIDPGGGGPVSQVNIQLRPKIDASNPSFAGVPQNALDFYQKGAAAAQKGNAKSAVEFLGKAVGAYPNFSAALSDLGVQYMKLGQMDKAAETFEALLKLKPNDATGHLDLGIAYYNLSTALVTEKKFDESNQKASQAETQLREALKLNSPGPTAHYYLGMSLIKLRRYDEAETELQLAISNGGENLAQAHRYLGGLYQRAQKNKEAVDELEKYLKLDPKAPDVDQIKKMISDLRSKP
jgi:regulator of sirC expression with transglutaminase-like and TPR domain